jgi:transcriptional regulator with XRE-family HTH domain
MKLLGKKIREARKIKRITQGELANAVGVSDKSISAYESGRIDPPIVILERIAHSTDHSVQYFLEESTETAILAKLTEIQRLFEEIKSALGK